MTNQYRLTVSINDKICFHTMKTLHCLCGVGIFDMMFDYIIIEMIDEVHDEDIMALIRILQRRGYVIKMSEVSN